MFFIINTELFEITNAKNKNTKFIIEKNNVGNWIVTDYTLHE